MNPEQKALYIELVNAGRFEDAANLQGALSSPRTGSVTRGERSKLIERGRAIGMEPSDLFLPEEPWGSKFLADMGAGFESQGLGINQLAQHMMPGRDTQDIDERVRQHQQEYQETGLADEMTGGQFMSNAIPALGGGILSRGALATMPIRTAMGLGAAEELPQPVVDDNYWAEKSLDLVVGAGIGLGTEGVPASMVRGTEIARDAPGAAYRSLQRPSRKEDGGWIRGSGEDLDINRALMEETGISFTPGDITQAPGVQQIEELARTGIFTSGSVKKSDAARAGQYDEYIKKFRDSLGDDAPIDVVAPKVQAWGRERAEELISARHNQANVDYRPVTTWADGQPVIPAGNYARELQMMIKRGKTAGASEDMARLAKGAEGRLKRLNDQGGFLTGADVEMLTRATDSKFSGTPFDLKDPTFNEQVASNLRQATLEDAKKVPELYDQLMVAKKNYGTASSHIDEFETGLVGQVLGKSFMNEVDGVISNTKSPEALFQKFRSASPTQITQALKHMDAGNPGLANQFRASMIERARQGAMFKPPAGGLTEAMDPAAFLRGLGITGGGEKGIQGFERLSAMFPDSPEFVHSMYRAGLILGDKSMANTSRSGVTMAANEVFQKATALIMGGIAAIKQAAILPLNAMGLRSVARSMEPDFGFIKPPQPVNLARTRRVREMTRAPVLATTAAMDDTP